ncbi:MAG: hypothetical protein IKA96_01140 [Alistipes sp.]|nr:hypothetical protein [Alistipes sp.]MBQ8779193.1 hypothetical protein [Alistipes sp.]MBR2398549.1 hypothetical protein [Alistipes sp.]
MPKEPHLYQKKNRIWRAILKIDDASETAAYLAYVRISRASKMPKEPP